MSGRITRGSAHRLHSASKDNNLAPVHDHTVASGACEGTGTGVVEQAVDAVVDAVIDAVSVSIVAAAANAFVSINEQTHLTEHTPVKPTSTMDSADNAPTNDSMLDSPVKPSLSITGCPVDVLESHLMESVECHGSSAAMNAAADLANHSQDKCLKSPKTSWDTLESAECPSTEVPSNKEVGSIETETAALICSPADSNTQGEEHLPMDLDSSPDTPAYPQIQSTSVNLQQTLLLHQPNTTSIEYSSTKGSHVTKDSSVRSDNHSGVVNESTLGRSSMEAPISAPVSISNQWSSAATTQQQAPWSRNLDKPPFQPSIVAHTGIATGAAGSSSGVFEMRLGETNPSADGHQHSHHKQLIFPSQQQPPHAASITSAPQSITPAAFASATTTQSCMNSGLIPHTPNDRGVHHNPQTLHPHQHQTPQSRFPESDHQQFDRVTSYSSHTNSSSQYNPPTHGSQFKPSDQYASNMRGFPGKQGALSPNRAAFQAMPASTLPAFSNSRSSSAASIALASSIPRTATQGSSRACRFPVYESLSEFDIVHQVGEGTYGKVFKAISKRTMQTVALKKIFLKEDDKGKDKNRGGFPITAIREIEILKSLKHKNIVDLQAMVSFSEGPNNVSMYMVFEYMDHDITGVLQHGSVPYEPAHIKCLVKQMFEGLAYLHSMNIIHRDIKGANLLLNNYGELKLADFGLARRIYIDRDSGEPVSGFDYTNRVVTLWYRPPELLLGSTSYGFEVDIWSAGCIFVEFFSKTAIFQGRSEIEQMDAIIRICGSPTVDIWPGVKNLSWHGLMQFSKTARTIEQAMRKFNMSVMAIKLIDNLLTLDPSKRLTAKNVLAHPYFQTEAPPPCDARQLPRIEGDWHEFEGKQRRKSRPAQSTHSQHSSGTTLSQPHDAVTTHANPTGSSRMASPVHDATIYNNASHSSKDVYMQTPLQRQRPLDQAGSSSVFPHATTPQIQPPRTQQQQQQQQQQSSISRHTPVHSQPLLSHQKNPPTDLHLNSTAPPARSGSLYSGQPLVTNKTALQSDEGSSNPAVPPMGLWHTNTAVDPGSENTGTSALMVPRADGVSGPSYSRHTASFKPVLSSGKPPFQSSSNDGRRPPVSGYKFGVVRSRGNDMSRGREHNRSSVQQRRGAASPPVHYHRPSDNRSQIDKIVSRRLQRSHDYNHPDVRRGPDYNQKGAGKRPYGWNRTTMDRDRDDAGGDRSRVGWTSARGHDPDPVVSHGNHHHKNTSRERSRSWSRDSSCSRSRGRTRDRSLSGSAGRSHSPSPNRGNSQDRIRSNSSSKSADQNCDVTDGISDCNPTSAIKSDHIPKSPSSLHPTAISGHASNSATDAVSNIEHDLLFLLLLSHSPLPSGKSQLPSSSQDAADEVGTTRSSSIQIQSPSSKSPLGESFAEVTLYTSTVDPIINPKFSPGRNSSLDSTSNKPLYNVHQVGDRVSLTVHEHYNLEAASEHPMADVLDKGSSQSHLVTGEREHSLDQGTAFSVDSTVVEDSKDMSPLASSALEAESAAVDPMDVDAQEQESNLQAMNSPIGKASLQPSCVSRDADIPSMASPSISAAQEPSRHCPAASDSPAASMHSPTHTHPLNPDGTGDPLCPQLHVSACSYSAAAPVSSIVKSFVDYPTTAPLTSSFLESANRSEHTALTNYEDLLASPLSSLSSSG
ncbi:hypothetical protein BSLG_000009 [Batrachochytrium salamandrivorans]|nr:hypothetical protein BSLG_000009 [Batrachochytrium salamandrivorans]